MEAFLPWAHTQLELQAIIDKMPSNTVITSAAWTEHCWVKELGVSNLGVHYTEILKSISLLYIQVFQGCGQWEVCFCMSGLLH